MSDDFRIRLRGSLTSLVCRHVHAWRRTDDEIRRELDMTNSNGPRETMRNYAILALMPRNAESVSLFVSRGGIPLFILSKGCLFFDVAGQPVQIEQVNT